MKKPSLLSKAQLKVARLIAKGFHRGEVAAKLKLALSTIHAHMRIIYLKTRIRGAVALRIWLSKNHLL